jgi:hypothetical protein
VSETKRHVPIVTVREVTKRTFWAIDVTYSKEKVMVWSSRSRDDVLAVKEFLTYNPRVALAAWQERGRGRAC